MEAVLKLIFGIMIGLMLIVAIYGIGIFAFDFLLEIVELFTGGHESFDFWFSQSEML